MILALLQTMRPKQWVKNSVVFAALIFDEKLSILSAALPTVAGFLLFCSLSSAVYIINDLADIEADRLHPIKKARPLPAGRLSTPIAWGSALVLILISIPLSFILSPLFGILAVSYLGLNLAYSFWFKHLPLLDVLVLATFYVLRVAAGVILVVVERFSPWLYLVTIFLALFIGIGKRRAEMTLVGAGGNPHRRVLDGYTIAFLDQLTIIVSTVTIITYSLYTFFAPNLPENNIMMLTIPFVIYGIFRYLYLVQIEESGGAPVDILFRDRPLQITLVLWGLTVLVIFYVL